jgi:hypothetical protein
VEYNNGTFEWNLGMMGVNKTVNVGYNNKNKQYGANVYIKTEIKSIDLFVQKEEQEYLFIAMRDYKNNLDYSGILRIKKKDIKPTWLFWFSFYKKDVDALFIFEWNNKLYS